MEARTAKKIIFISGDILNEVLNVIMKNGYECSIVRDGGGFRITYDDTNIRFLEKLLQQKQKEYDEISKKVYELKEKYAKLKEDGQR